MCILIIKPMGVKVPPLDILENCATHNPHGCGFAAANKIFRSLNFYSFYDRLSKLTTEDAAIIHFRYATQGSVRMANCHPFTDQNTGISFAHNGTIPIMTKNDKTDSETAFRLKFMPTISLYGLDSEELNTEVESIIGSSKIVFIDSLGNIRTFGNFIEHNGCYYSNYTFKR